MARNSYRKKFKSSNPWVIRSVLAIAVLSVAYVFWLPDVRVLATTNPATTSLISDRGDSGLALTWVGFERIPASLKRAVIVAEDSQYWNHEGVDIGEIWSSIREALTGFHLPRGASTITQQLAKNLYLSESYNPLRKIKEYFIARRLERTLSKKRILEIYLNVIEWGPHIYGIGAAAQHYFQKKPADLTEAQAALLAAIIPNPLTTYNPVLNPSRVNSRQRIILRKMATTNKIAFQKPE